MTSMFGKKPLIFALLFLGVAASRAAEEIRTIRALLIICDNYEGDAGAINLGVKSDRYLINEILTEQISEQGWGARIEIDEVSGIEANKPVLTDRLAKFYGRVEPQDTVFVYFSGHGVILDQRSNDIQLQTCDNQLISRQRLADEVNGLPARLKILITDCCSSFSPFEVAEGSDEVIPWSTLYFLLLRHEGFVNITAASPGEEAYATAVGSFLTVNLQSDMQRYKTWEEVFRETRKRVIAETRKDAPRQQTPLAFSLGRPVEALAAGRDVLPASAGYVIPDSSRRILTRDELERMGLQQLYLARNEIVARHGYYFKTPMLLDYFKSRAWYESEEGHTEYDLSTVEAKNVTLIRKVEEEKGGPFIGPGGTERGDGSQPDIFSYSSERALSRTVVESLTLPQISIARNEIYARHGYPFKSTFLKEYFSSKPYYRRNEDDTDPQFNQVEQLNIWLLNKIERLKGGPHKW